MTESGTRKTVHLQIMVLKGGEATHIRISHNEIFLSDTDTPVFVFLIRGRMFYGFLCVERGRDGEQCGLNCGDRKRILGCGFLGKK